MAARVLMLGWEFPPFITGGLGTACYGLVKAMDRAGMKTTFVLPKSVPGGEVEDAPRVSLVSPATDLPEMRPEFQSAPDPAPTGGSEATGLPSRGPRSEQGVQRVLEIVREMRTRFRNVEFVDLPVEVQSVYTEQAAVWSRVVQDCDVDERRIETLIRAGAFGDPEETVDDTSALQAAMPERDPAAATMSSRNANAQDY